MSEEHYLSASIIGRADVRVEGLPFLKGASKTIPGDRLTRNMLCEVHNRALSPLDAAAGHFVRVIKAFRDHAFRRLNHDAPPRDAPTYLVDGAYLERWCLKTTINIMVGRRLSHEAIWSPSDLWVRCAFGVVPFPAGFGFYLASGEFNWVQRSETTIGIRLLTDPVDENRLIGSVFRIEDVQFALSMHRLHPKHAGEYRVRTITDGSNLERHQVINFDWSRLAAG